MPSKKSTKKTHITVQHVRRGRHGGRRVATLTAEKHADGIVRIGYAKCHMDRDDFTEEKGVSIALERARAIVDRGNRVDAAAKTSFPDSIEEAMQKFIIRAYLYYKTADIVVCHKTDAYVANVIGAFKAMPKPVKKLA